MVEGRADSDPAREGPILLETQVTREPVEIAKDTFEIKVAKPAGMTFTAGQAMKFFLEVEGEWVKGRTFSMVSAPHESELTFAFRMSETAFKQQVRSMTEGTRLMLRAPQDELPYPTNEEPETPVVMLAGGIGVTPFISMLRHAEHTGDKRNFHLYSVNPEQEHAAYVGELYRLSGTTGVRNNFFLSRDGDVDAAEPAVFCHRKFDMPDLSQFLNHTPPALFLIAGPPHMTQYFEKALAKAGVSTDRIKTSEFSGYKGENDVDR